MFQRPLDYYQSLGSSDKAQVDVLLQDLGGFDGMQKKIKRRVKRVNNILVPEEQGE